jgi:Na+-translocating ferredoxin:NAD+ oxidoreductase subunit C
LFGRFGFRGGIFPRLHKERTEGLAIERLAAPPRVVLHMAQHIGSPAIPIVKRGDHVLVGQTVGEAAGMLSSPVHSSVSGTVASIGAFPHPSGMHGTAIEIENDGANTCAEKILFDKPWKESAPGEILQIIASAGIVGMGGGAFPTHVKLSPPSHKPVDTLIINGVECEPFSTADHRLMVEKIEEILSGSLMIKKILAAKTVFFAINSHNAPAIRLVSAALNDPKFKDISLSTLKTKYPMGSEKQLVYSLTKRTVPRKGTPVDAGCMVQNVATARAVHLAVSEGTPLFERVVTISGPAIRLPKNLWVKIGTPLRFVLEQCAMDPAIAKKIVIGGAMTGMAQSELDVPVLKSTAAILAFGDDGPRASYHCISCGACVRACPMRLVPSRLAKFVNKNLIADARGQGVVDCIECGSCAYACPAKINLVHFMKLGKYWVDKQQKEPEVRSGHDR